jgi:hypothetical protein
MIGTDEDRSCELAVQRARLAWVEWERRSAPTRRARAVDQRRSPALADIIGARRMRTVAMISSGSIPCR